MTPEMNIMSEAMASDARRRPRAGFRRSRAWLLLSVCLAAGSVHGQETDATADGDKDAKPAVKWFDSLASGYADAAQRGTLLFARAGAEWCGPCRMLDREIAKAAAQVELAGWTCVYIDVDKSRDDARTMAAGTIPALRVYTPSGQLVASTEGGMSAAVLVEWLKSARGSVNTDELQALTVEGKPSVTDAVRLARQIANREPAIREAAIRRLAPYPSVAAIVAVNAMKDGNLATRLSVLELLSQWGAPVDGLDPWQPDTINDDRLASLITWAREPHADADGTRDAPDIEAAREDITRLLRAETQADVLVVRERLVRYGVSLLPEIDARLLTAAGDDANQRLMALRYRLQASDKLVLSWPGGIDRLASPDARTRHAAAAQLTKRATTDDNALLLDLLKDPDPRVREISLKALNSFDTAQARQTLVDLLADPEPNVRAAVLKQMAESPQRWMVDAMSSYVEAEEDTDLVVHAVRVLSTLEKPEALTALTSLFDHPSWRVRAEAAESVGGLLDSMYDLDVDDKSDVYVALLKLLDDSDGFVVARALGSLEEVDLAAAVDPLVNLVERRPELAAEAIDVLAGGDRMKAKAIPHLENFCRHEQPAVRAAAIAGLCRVSFDDPSERLVAALADEAKEVRVAAATALFERLQDELPDADESSVVDSSSRSLLSTLLGLERNTQDKTRRQKPTHDEWLERFHAGQDRPDWLNATIAPLQQMRGSNDPEERAAAVPPLVALGAPGAVNAARDLLTSAEASPEDLSPILPWLAWSDRSAMYVAMTEAGRGGPPSSDIMRAMVEVRDPRAAEILWKSLASDELDTESLSLALESLNRLYFGSEYFYDADELSRADRLALSKVAQQHLEKGSESERFAALALLAKSAPDELPAAAARIRSDPASSDVLRRDALQFLLGSSGQNEARQAAIDAIGDGTTEERRLALQYLAEGAQELSLFRQRIYIPLGSRITYYSGDSVDLSAPKGLEAAALRPLVASEDAEIAAYACYFLTLLEQEGTGELDRLIEHWQQAKASKAQWTKLVYRAMAARNDDSRSEILTKIFESLKTEEWEVREFYWTIRSMTGPNVLTLRKRIRDEVGMDALR